MASSRVRATVEQLLRARKLDTTLTSVHPFDALNRLWATDLPDLDRRLGGGLPCGQVSAIVGPRSSGRTGLLYGLLAAATARGDIVALIDAHDAFDPAAAEASGVRLSRVLWVRGPVLDRPGGAPGRGERSMGPLTRTGRRDAAAGTGARLLERALKAMHLVVEAGGFGLVVLDLVEVLPPALRRLPLTTWRRLQRGFEGRDTVGLVLASGPVARSAGGVTLVLNRGGVRWQGTSACSRLLGGVDVEVHIERARHRLGDDARATVHLSARHD
jgi:hypothetical protein